jgi:hypothetical protein
MTAWHRLREAWSCRECRLYRHLALALAVLYVLAWMVS